MFLGPEEELVREAHRYEQGRLAPSPEDLLLTRLRSGTSRGHQLVVGYTESGEEVSFSVEKLAGVHRWSTGATGSGKSAQGLAEELQLIVPNAPWSLLHLDAKSESAGWFTDIFLPAIIPTWKEKEAVHLLDNLAVINPFDSSNIPPLNILLPLPGVPRGIQAREVASLISEALGSHGGNWGSRMTNVLSFALRAALDLENLSLLEVRALLMKPEYLNAILPHIKDQDVRDYFVYRYSKESKEAIRAVISRLDLLLVEQTARVLCAPTCLDFGDILERPLSIIDVGNAPRGGEFLSHWWLGVFVRGISRAILGRQDTRKPCFCVLDEWWTALDLELASHFERLLSLARFKRVGLWLLNQLPGQVGSKSPLLLATIKNSCGLQIAFRQSHEDARGMSYMLPVSDSMRIRKNPDAPAWDTRIAKPEEQRRMLVEELTRLPNRTFWLYPKMLGSQAVKLEAPTVPFKEAKEFARNTPEWLRQACRGHGKGLTQRYLDDVLEMRRAHISDVSSGIHHNPIPDFERKSYSIDLDNYESENTRSLENNKISGGNEFHRAKKPSVKKKSSSSRRPTQIDKSSSKGEWPVRTKKSSQSAQVKKESVITRTSKRKEQLRLEATRLIEKEKERTARRPRLRPKKKVSKEIVQAKHHRSNDDEPFLG